MPSFNYCDTVQKNGGKNGMKSDAKNRLLRENSKIFQPTFSVLELWAIQNGF